MEKGDGYRHTKYTAANKSCNCTKLYSLADACKTSLCHRVDRFSQYGQQTLS